MHVKRETMIVLFSYSNEAHKKNQRIMGLVIFI